MAGGFLADDLAAMFDGEEFAVQATWTSALGASTSALVLFDRPGTTVLDEIVATEPSVRFRTADWPGIRERDQIVLDSDTYRVQRVTALDDGATSRAMLAKLAAA